MHIGSDPFPLLPDALSHPFDQEEWPRSGRTASHPRLVRCYHATSRLFHVRLDGAGVNTLDRVTHWRSHPGYGEFLDLPVRIHLSAVELPKVRGESVCGERLVSVPVRGWLRPILTTHVPKPGDRPGCLSAGRPVVPWCCGNVLFVAVRRLSPFEEHICTELDV